MYINFLIISNYIKRYWKALSLLFPIALRWLSFKFNKAAAANANLWSIILSSWRDLSPWPMITSVTYLHRFTFFQKSNEKVARFLVKIILTFEHYKAVFCLADPAIFFKQIIILAAISSWRSQFAQFTSGKKFYLK